MRIVGGALGGRRLNTPRSPAIRPTADRLRESLFNILTHGHDEPIPEARVLDLFAGTGALGLEALSRGAAYALFIDTSAEARALIRSNIEQFGLGGVTSIFRRDATHLGPRLNPTRPYSLVFADPPYGSGLAERALVSARTGTWLTPDALVVVEEAVQAFKTPKGFVQVERRTYDDSELTFLRLGV